MTNEITNVTTVNALYTVYTATVNQIDLLDALKALELTDVVEDNIKLYQDAAKELSELQEIIENNSKK